MTYHLMPQPLGLGAPVCRRLAVEKPREISAKGGDWESHSKMKTKRPPEPHAKLSGEKFTRCMEAALDYLKTNTSIRNSKLREITGIEYDQAITFFNLAIDAKILVRHGQSSGTHYVLFNRGQE